jgi:hypothetical protein
LRARPLRREFYRKKDQYRKGEKAKRKRSEGRDLHERKVSKNPQMPDCRPRVGWGKEFRESS